MRCKGCLERQIPSFPPIGLHTRAGEGAAHPQHLALNLAPLHSKEGLGSQRSGQDTGIHLCEVLFSLPSTAKWTSLWEDPAEHLLGRAKADEPRARELSSAYHRTCSLSKSIAGSIPQSSPGWHHELEMKFSCIWMWLTRFKQTVTWRTALSFDWSTFYLSSLVTRTAGKFIQLLREEN